MTQTGTRRPRLLSAVTTAVIVLGIALLGFGIWKAFFAGGSSAIPAEGAARVAVEPRENGAQSQPPASEPVAISIPAIGFDAAVEPLAIGAAEVIYPPSADRAYWLEEFGAAGAGAENTAYIVGHASADGRAVFDPLVNRVEQRTTVMPGDEIVVETAAGSAVYEVVVTERHPKSALSEIENLWSAVPDRLVLVTCFFSADGSSASDNMVLYARLKS